MKLAFVAILMLSLAGCGTAPAYKSQISAAEISVETLQKNVETLQTDVKTSCGTKFNERFDLINSELNVLRAQIQAIAPAADADIQALNLEIYKRNWSIFGLVVLLILMGWYALKKDFI